jgi:hypothetical protein
MTSRARTLLALLDPFSCFTLLLSSGRNELPGSPLQPNAQSEDQRALAAKVNNQAVAPFDVQRPYLAMVQVHSFVLS